MMQFENPLKFGTDLWDPSHRYETSWLLPPYALFAVRATLVRSIPFLVPSRPCLSMCLSVRPRFGQVCSRLDIWYQTQVVKAKMFYASSARRGPPDQRST